MKPWLLTHQLMLSQQFSSATLPHAILISGVTGSGKLALAQWLVKLLSCKQPNYSGENEELKAKGCGHCKSCLLLNSNTFPDHLNLVAQKSSIGVDEIRDAISFLQKTAYLAQFKTLLINKAQTMTQAAMNALLKTLEEPSDNSVIILLTEDADILLPTIISRCRVLNIRPAVGESLLAQFNGQDSQKQLSATDALTGSAFVNLTQLPELTDAETNNAFQRFKSCYIDYLCYQNNEPELLQHLLASEHALRWLEQVTANLHRECLLAQSEHDYKQILNHQLLNNLYKVIINACKVIKSYTQANKQFVIEQLIMSISDVVEENKLDSH